MILIDKELGYQFFSFVFLCCWIDCLNSKGIFYTLLKEEKMGHWIWMGIIGLLAGALVKLVMPGKDGGGIIITMLLGIAGALLMTLLGKAVGWYEPGEGAGFIGAFLGAVILLLGYRQIKKR